MIGRAYWTTLSNSYRYLTFWISSNLSGEYLARDSLCEMTSSFILAATQLVLEDGVDRERLDGTDFP